MYAKRCDNRVRLVASVNSVILVRDEFEAVNWSTPRGYLKGQQLWRHRAHRQQHPT